MFYRCLALVVLFSLMHAAAGQGYPSRTSKIVVPFSAGATNDILARLLAQHLGDQTKQSFIVENRPGGAGIPGTEYVAKSPPDGYTLLMGNTTLLGIMVSLAPKLSYDPVRDFDPVSVLAIAPSALVVNPAVPAKNIAELISLLKENPGKFNYGSAGNGTPFHLSGELFKAQTGTQIAHVPYKGNAPAIADLLAGRVQMLFANTPDILSHIRSGKLRAMVATGATRLAQLPEVPTVGEAGFKGAESTSWFAIVSPRGTPREIVSKLSGEIVRAVQKADFRQRLADFGAEPVGSTPEGAADHIRKEIAKWAVVIRESGAKIDQ